MQFSKKFLKVTLARDTWPWPCPGRQDIGYYLKLTHLKCIFKVLLFVFVSICTDKVIRVTLNDIGSWESVGCYSFVMYQIFLPKWFSLMTKSFSL